MIIRAITPVGTFESKDYTNAAEIDELRNDLKRNTHSVMFEQPNGDPLMLGSQVLKDSVIEFIYHPE